MAGYEINYDYYAKELCENKNSPEMHCQGKCFFAKQLALEENGQDNSEAPNLLPDIRLFQISEISNLFNPFSTGASQKYLSWNQVLPQDFFLSDIERPPRS
ncbi:MAG: hypothetical protein U5L96_14585 [Owenweeksia sp.]|nr:hypothetical protein [Owenweeksia sp.]